MAEQRVKQVDPFLVKYQPSELKIASEFLSTWLPFLSRDLCPNCTDVLSNRIQSLELVLEGDSKQSSPDAMAKASTSSSVIQKNEMNDNRECNCDEVSLGSGNNDDDANSLGSLKGCENELPKSVLVSSSSGLAGESPFMESSPIPRMSWADMAQEDELEGEEDEEIGEDGEESSKRLVDVNSSTGELRISKVMEMPKLSRAQREHLRFTNLKRKKDFICLERVNGRLVNVVDGIELHEKVFSAKEQERIVDYVYMLEEKGRKGELKERTFSAPNKWMKGKGRVTIQFGCCYNYAPDRKGNPPGILYNEMVDPLPHLFKVIIRRLVSWHVLPPSCVPDSCIVNIYEEGDCIPPHIDNHDFIRPFCTVSFLSECNILFGSNLKVDGPGEFSGSMAIPLPVGSVLVLNGNGADVAKHCVPAVPTKRISITFRRMDDSKRPAGYTPEPDLLGIQPLTYEAEKTSKLTSPRSDQRHSRRRSNRRGNNNNVGERESDVRREPHSEPRYSSRGRGLGNWRRAG